MENKYEPWESADCWKSLRKIDEEIKLYINRDIVEEAIQFENFVDR